MRTFPFQPFLFFGIIYTGIWRTLRSLENWYYRILILMTGNWKNAELAVDALSVWCVVFSNSTLLVSNFVLQVVILLSHLSI